MDPFSPFEAFAILAFATGTAELLNARFLKLPSAMGLVIMSLLVVVQLHILIRLIVIFHQENHISIISPLTEELGHKK